MRLAALVLFAMLSLAGNAAANVRHTVNISPSPWLYNLIVDGQPIARYQGVDGPTIASYFPMLEEQQPSTLVITHSDILVHEVQLCLGEANQVADPKTYLYDFSGDGRSAKGQEPLALEIILDGLGNGIGNPRLPDWNGWIAIIFVLDSSLDPWGLDGGHEAEWPTEQCLSQLAFPHGSERLRRPF